MDQSFDSNITISPPIHKDLRSLQRECNRNAKQSNKYYGYRSVDPKWVGQRYYALCPRGSDNISQFDETWYSSCAPLVTMPQLMKPRIYTKRDMYLDCSGDIWPLDRRHHKGRRVREKYAVKWAQLAMGTRLKQRSKRLAFEVSTGMDLAADWGDIDDAECSFDWGDDGKYDDWEAHEPLTEAFDSDQTFTWTSSENVDAEFSPTDDFVLVYAPSTQYRGNLAVHNRSDSVSDFCYNADVSFPDLYDSSWEWT
ncbi:hypothetical protein B0A52_07869 [Exophiala mesophila]|uniref:Uncharacterized protein n=1 Tax=Exophiala mesophila TaxID=212818 RepID=A0A438MVI6_EXOME|nr:hypothetical protein B0A52_07869 [Exophiala mesophila]